MAQVFSVLEVEELANEDQAYLGVLVDLSDLLDDAQDCLKVTAVFEHTDEDCLEVFLEEVFGLLRCLVLPLDDLVPDGSAELHDLDDEV